MLFLPEALLKAKRLPGRCQSLARAHRPGLTLDYLHAAAKAAHRMRTTGARVGLGMSSIIGGGTEARIASAEIGVALLEATRRPSRSSQGISCTLQSELDSLAGHWIECQRGVADRKPILAPGHSEETGAAGMGCGQPDGSISAECGENRSGIGALQSIGKPPSAMAGEVRHIADRRLPVGQGDAVPPPGWRRSDDGLKRQRFASLEQSMPSNQSIDVNGSHANVTCDDTGARHRIDHEGGSRPLWEAVIAPANDPTASALVINRDIRVATIDQREVRATLPQPPFKMRPIDKEADSRRDVRSLIFVIRSNLVLPPVEC